MTLGGLLSAPPAIVAAGVDVFSDALRAQGAEVHDVDWRPPGFGDPADLPRSPSTRAGPPPTGRRSSGCWPPARELVDVRPARDVIGLADRTLLHSGPPLTWEMASGPDARRADRRLPVRGLGVRRSRRPRGSSPPARSRSTPATTTGRSARWRA